MYSNFEMTYNSYLMHHGTKGMKCGVMRTIARKSILPGSWGRAVTTSRQHDLDIKNRWTVAKNKARAGVLSKNSQEYREAKSARQRNFWERLQPMLLDSDEHLKDDIINTEQTEKVLPLALLLILALALLFQCMRIVDNNR